MNLFIDGLIFGRQRWGGISRMWEALLDRLPQEIGQFQLLVPAWWDNVSLTRLLENRRKKNPSFSVKLDYFNWPVRFFEPVPIRSLILKSLYLTAAVDIFHSTYFSTLRDCKIKKVATVYDMIPELFQRFSGGKWVEKEIAKKKATLLNADKVITISHHAKMDLIRIYPQIPPDRVDVIHLGLFETSKILKHSGLPESVDEPSFEKTLKSVGLSGDPNIRSGQYYLYVGNRQGYKNFDLLVQLAVSKKNDKKLIFICVGGEDSASDKKKLAELGLTHFFFTGFVNDYYLATLYKHASAMICPSLYEGFGLPVLEAMAHCCPVACAQVSSLPEVGGDAAFYFDPQSISSLDDALNRLEISNREQTIRRGLQNSQRFSWDTAVKKLAGVYHSLLA